MDPSEAPMLARARNGAERWLPFVIAGLGVAVMLLAWGWWGARSELAELREGVAQQLRETGTEARDSRIVSKETQDAVRDALARIGALEAKLLESQSQQLALEALYQELSRNRDEWQLAEIEQVLAIAQQQLQLSGNVRAALLALQLAESRLARADRPQFLPVRRALARDIERLRAVPGLDLSGISLKLDSLVAAVDSLPLAFDERTPKLADESAPLPAAEKEGKATSAENGFFARFGAEVWREAASSSSCARSRRPSLRCCRRRKPTSCART